MHATTLVTPKAADVAVCAGTPREMGLAQGLALRAKIVAARAALARLEAFRLRQPRWLPYPAYRALAGRKAWRDFVAPLRSACPGGVERLEGIAAGSGLGISAVALFNALEPLLCSAGGCTACPAACSAVAVRGRRSATGGPVIARNFDYLPLVRPFYAVRESRPAGGLRSLDFTTAPLAGAVDGVNERGLCVAYDYAFTTDLPDGPAPPLSWAVSAALERCGTVAEAAERIASRPRWGGGLLMLADAGGDVASLELSSTRSFLRRPGPGEDAICHSNAFASPAMREVQVPDAAVYDGRAPTPLRGRRLHLSSELRDDRFRRLLAATDVFDEAALGRVMADHGPDGAPGDGTPCVHGSYWSTTATLRLIPAERRMRFAFDAACRAEFRDAAL